MRKINRIVLHCSDSDNPDHDDVSVIRKWHTQERGWSDVGYHEFIKDNGDIQLGRPIHRNGAHVKGFNRNSIGICYHGKTVNNDQYKTLIRSVVKYISIFNLDINQVFGHYELDNRSCPNFNMLEFRLNLLQYLKNNHSFKEMIIDFS